MKNTVVVVGSQWGDEGKGKITHYLSKDADMVVRYQGGDNAGHTIRFHNQTHKLQLIPSGVFQKNTINLLGNGMVINPKHFLTELSMLQEVGYDCTNVVISDRAHVLFEFHRTLDKQKETNLGLEKIGTTQKGIGPAYTDKIAREGIRIADFIAEDFPTVFKKKLVQKIKNTPAFQNEPLDIEELVLEYATLATKIKPYVVDGIKLLHDALSENKHILFEGAQGTLLDIDLGTYPYVTSSNPTTGGATIGAGIGPTFLKESIGVVKAYSTRVGEGAFPTEFEDDIARTIRDTANEYGTVTRRPRRIGWLDAVLLRYSAMVNGFTGISLMLLDVLSGIDSLSICTSYTLGHQTITTLPARIQDFEQCKPNYITLPGWSEDITNVRTFDDLPENAKRYIQEIETLCGVPVVIFSVGPDMEQTIVRKHPFQK